MFDVKYMYSVFFFLYIIIPVLSAKNTNMFPEVQATTYIVHL